MGSFHCPLGSPFYEGNGCILCGLCIAETREEMVKASERIRAYIRTQTGRKGIFKKITVCGKGGVGKSTIVALLGEVLKDEGYSVLVMDTDESNPGLYRKLGFEKEPIPLMNLLSRLVSAEPDPDTEWIIRDEFSIADISPEYIMESDGLKLMVMGKIEDPFQGCACSMADLTRSLMDKLCLADNEIVLIDTEAGVESFGRGVERSVDTALIVVEPSLESLSVAEKIGYMADGMGIRMVRAVLNKVPSEELRKKMVEILVLKNISQAGAVNHDLLVAQTGFEGKSPGPSKAKEEVKDIVRRLLQECH
jgi:CO dehydrogenase maturation factor